MKKKQAIIFGSLLSVAAVCGTCTILCNSSIPNDASSNDSTYTYEHYSAFAPTFESHGSKEYWISCDDPSHKINLTKPTEYKKINDPVTPTEEFVKGLTSSDSRYAERYRKVLSFEDGMPSFIKVTGSQTNSITTDEHTQALKSLKIELTGSAMVSMNRELLTAMFALDGVDALLFDVKCANVPDYTKATLMYMRSASDQYGVRRFDDSYCNKGVTVRGDNIRTYWKTFMITADMFADLNADNGIMRFDNMSGNTIYIDNIRVGKNQATNPDVITFNGHSAHNTSGNKWEILNLYKNYTADTWGAELKIYSNSTLTVEFTDKYATEGGTSLHLVSSGLIRLGITKTQYDSMGDNDYVEFDYFVDPDSGNDQHIYTVAWGTYIGCPTNWSKTGKWVTFKINKSQIGTTTDLDNNYYCICTASGATNVYVDNIRLVRPATNNIDFENGTVTTFNSTRYAYASNYDGKYFDVNLGAKNGTDIWYQGNFTVSLSEERSTNGAYSLKSTVTATNGGLYISEKLYNQIGEDGLSMDIYATAAVNFNSLVDGQKGLHDWDPGKWITLVVPKSYIGQNGSGEYCLFTYGNITTTYIDNVHLVTSEAKDSDLTTQTTYNWYN